MSSFAIRSAFDRPASVADVATGLIVMDPLCMIPVCLLNSTFVA